MVTQVTQSHNRINTEFFEGPSSYTWLHICKIIGHIEQLSALYNVQFNQSL